MSTALAQRPLSPVRQRKLLDKANALKPYLFDCGGRCHHLPLNEQGQPHDIWGRHARRSQLARTEADARMADWVVWLIQSGRGWGKTLAGAKWITSQALKHPKTDWAVIGPTYNAVRSNCIDGATGILAALPPGFVKSLNYSNKELRLANGSLIYWYGAEDRDTGVRGKSLAGAWCDELGFWPYVETWDAQLYPAVGRMQRRAGDILLPPKIMITTTPRPTDLMKVVLAEKKLIVTRASTFENVSNMSPSQIEALHDKYDGTSLGRQEIEGELLDDTEGALWKTPWIKHGEIDHTALQRIVIGVDPAGTHKPTSDLTGIVVCGVMKDGTYWVLADYSGRYRPEEWAGKVVDAYDYFKADAVIGEKTYGGDMVEHTIRTIRRDISYKNADATRGKQLRAEPVAMLYQQNSRPETPFRVQHLAQTVPGGDLAALEDEMTHWVPGVTKKSPDHVDALVWAMTDLMNRKKRVILGASYA